jgi:hypothetical protein
MERHTKQKLPAMFFRNKVNFILWPAALVLAFVLVVYLVAAGRFLVGVGRAAFGGSLIKSAEIVTFNLAKAAAVRASRPQNITR